ncbi:DUF397 domain-containing protein [Streptomyces griseoincarnatus]|uniref:DUF397 domain-containing protein n=1 Tax=Streptomyces albogriseolus TaxID=1887 RepID=UPI003F4A115A
MKTAESTLTWFKSSYSDTEGGQCVEVAPATAVVHVRDSKVEAGPILTISREAWAGLVELTSSERHV